MDRSKKTHSPLLCSASLMNLYHSFILGIIQGITEFLPISSDGHLVLMEHYLGLSIDPHILMTFDIVLHLGSLIAIFVYFAKQWMEMARHPFRKQSGGGPPLLVLLFFASIPVGIVGFLSMDWIETNTRTPLFVAFGFIFTGAFLIVSSWFELRFASRESYGWKQAMGAGIGQAIAILPGFSRSGLSIASGRLMGLSAVSATEFSFLLGAPAILGAVLYTFLKSGEDIFALGMLQVLIGFFASLVMSLAVIHFLLSTVRRYGFWIWAAYLFIAAALILADEMLPLVRELPNILEQLDIRVIAGVVFVALLLESIPLTSFFVPGLATLIAVTLFLSNDVKNLVALVPIATAGLVLGHLFGYIPARQARLIVRWKDKADSRLTKAQHFFRKWGVYAVFFGGWWAPIRPWISISAGLGNMRPLPYMLAMISGSLVFVIGVITITLLLGKAIF